MAEEVPGQPEPATQPQTIAQVAKYALLGIFGLLLLGVTTYAGYWWGTRSEKLKAKSEKPNLKSQILTPILPVTVAPQPTFPAEPTPSSVETTGWKSYTNTQLGFSIDYPGGWLPQEFSRDFARVGKSIGVIFTTDGSWGFVNIEVEDNQEGLSIDNFIDNYLCDAPGVCASSEEIIPMFVSSLPGKRVINPPAPVESQIVVVVKGKKIFNLGVTLDRSFEELYSVSDKEKIFNLMLSTFKFLN